MHYQRATRVKGMEKSTDTQARTHFYVLKCAQMFIVKPPHNYFGANSNNVRWASRTLACTRTAPTTDRAIAEDERVGRCTLRCERHAIRDPRRQALFPLRVPRVDHRPIASRRRRPCTAQVTAAFAAKGHRCP